MTPHLAAAAGSRIGRGAILISYRRSRKYTYVYNAGTDCIIIIHESSRVHLPNKHTLCRHEPITGTGRNTRYNNN